MTAQEQAWKALIALGEGAATPAQDLLNHESDRPTRLSLDAAGLHADFSKLDMPLAGLDAFLDVARAAQLETRRGALFDGAAINATENRPVMHWAWRAAPDAEIRERPDAMAEVVEARTRLKTFAEAVKSGAHAGAAGRPIRTILHVGIGGSDYGPRLIWEALKYDRDPRFDVRFVANVDGADVNDALEGADPETTLAIFVSKSFGTQETARNAEAILFWLEQNLGKENVGPHVAAVSSAIGKAGALGVPEGQVFAVQDWVGGRYSLWSSVGLVLEIALNAGAFDDLRKGAQAMDAHFRDAPLAENLPVLMACADVWNRNVKQRPVRIVAPYASRLTSLSGYLQQLEMESNGKGVGLDGKPVERATAPFVFGEVGTNAQHAFYQQLHQGPDTAPVEFIGVLDDPEARPAQHQALLANMIAQAEALMVGRAADPQDRLGAHRACPGGRPSTTILLDKLDPPTLGALLAAYEHKVFVLGALWGINAFDQWGVELGKTLANDILDELQGGETRAHDASTAALIDRVRRHHS